MRETNLAGPQGHYPVHADLLYRDEAMARSVSQVSLASLVSLAFGAWLASACTGSASRQSEGATLPPEIEEAKLGEQPSVQVMISVDWEGRDLTPQNLRAMRELRQAMPSMRIVQFLNAAYFTKPGANASAVTADIRSVLLPQDELGLHVHAWKSLVQGAGVPFRLTPTFTGGTSGASFDCSYDCGGDVPLSEYTERQIERIVGFSIETLSSHGFGRARSFRAGGWMATASVREALVVSGIVWDASAVPPPLLANELRGYPVFDWLSELWQGIDSSSQPYVVHTAAGPLSEVPNNGALADYTTEDEMVALYQDAKSRFLTTKTTQVVSIGFHQETAQAFVPRVRAAYARMTNAAKAENIVFGSVTTRTLQAGDDQTSKAPTSRDR